jgi:hypothetical protein
MLTDMVRAARYSEKDFIDAAGVLVADGDFSVATMQAIVRRGEHQQV